MIKESRDIPKRIQIAAVPVSGRDIEWSGQVPGSVTTTTFVRIETTAGFVGHGATAAYSAHVPDFSHVAAAEVLAAGLITEQSAEPATLLRLSNAMPLTPQTGAVSALDIALWDAIGQRAQLPLYRLLGGADRPLRGYASMPFLGSIDGYLDSLAELCKAGYAAFKLHTWCEFDRDLELVVAVSEAFAGDDVDLMLDVEQAYSRQEAARMAKVLDDYAWRWFEAPLPDTDIEGYVGLRQRCVTSILNSGNRVLDTRAVVAALQAGAWDSVRFDTTIAGGITAARGLTAVADVFDLPVDLQSWGHTLIEAANLHAALGFTTSQYFEIAVPRDAYELGVQTPIRINDNSQVRANDEPGLGVRLDWDQIKDAAIVYRDIN